MTELRALAALASITVLLALASCGGSTSLASCADATSTACTQDEAKMTLITTCNGYANSLMSLSAVRQKLPTAVITSVDESVAVVQPLCHGQVADSQGALATVQAELGKLQAAQFIAAGGK